MSPRPRSGGFFMCGDLPGILARIATQGIAGGEPGLSRPHRLVLPIYYSPIKRLQRILYITHPQFTILIAFPQTKDFILATIVSAQFLRDSFVKKPE